MGEEGVRIEEAMDWEIRETEAERERERSEKKMKEDGAASVVRWEKFLPRMVLRVLLVEADDSTRQIIAALLRKCSYRVAAVPDGLKAWEVLKGKPHNIDLILTEVDLPSISGFALLTLITEHEICKNIPVIMMSSNDSISMVYKCMLRGAADFLVKPVRKNELRNLWQHVWRRQSSSSGGHGPQNESVAQQKAEATAENNATSNHSSGFRACVERNRECIEKGSDAQSSCTKPDLESERAHTENVQDSLQHVKIQKHEECVKSSNKLRMNDCEDRGLVVATCEDANAMTQREDMETESGKGQANIVSEACCTNHVLVNSSREAIDLIGAFDNYLKCDFGSSFSNSGMHKFDSSPPLDLSLRRFHSSGSVNQVSDGRHTLNHSDASAFSRYVNRALQPPHSSVPMSNQQKDYGTNSDRELSNHILNHNSETHYLSLSSQKNMLSLATDQSGQVDGAFPSPQKTVLPFPVPMRGIRFDSLGTAYGSVIPQMFCTQSGLSRHEEPSIQVNAFHQSNLEIQTPRQLIDQNANNCAYQTEHKQRQNWESSDDRRHFSSATDQSASSSFCNGTASHLNSIGCGSNGNVDQAPVVRAAAESGKEEGVCIHDRNSHRSVQREAALNKFRLKRKDRCFEKKVRYESRKKLAEQRPRVKGQFVRQAQNEMEPVGTEYHCGNSLDS
ncbi:Two-component response regulator-like [Actinidia chinensis var. chinensis]|uniref:Two-component response regulator-like n=1 Tax=Actinidia chinensis var. chinensis TaxID=1590841 RepID=A0A2R6RQI2_ACTCC|nr:Two-component response regulator-like [Actinidia chinensis var. chinensis]